MTFLAQFDFGTVHRRKEQNSPDGIGESGVMRRCYLIHNQVRRANLMPERWFFNAVQVL
jgi:hypothetical protein